MDMLSRSAMYDVFSLNFIIYIIHNVATRVIRSNTVWISPSMMKLQYTLTAKNITVRT